ncbi:MULTISPECIES: hypothetical protein [unclassified Rhodococcus (in: high G+C Gram-positive bacteria)]|uniref:hypothetical protein n=1 Tax=unclassified Rhodococcus (in: high G+C Gram-positive bacteria) TaxID=192944 RepID=UPI00146E38C6|nr:MULTISPECIES: hypothetical protein [unclassified Rhodococcus (in: high G+C Gram-positive bacteria)]MBF0660158.1 hypothetical protein [Rhodococcus sp. (in: high G+C Gram-positive bacteria)]NMD96070.1 hypothetical protein [Rhodococcus sp. BL-253-APC-6A1W]NME79012.1 hypothetical protein [Rhodococcus sp. 105337]
MTCRECDSRIDHCHGSLILHSAVEVECTDDTCVDLSIVRHALVAECTDLVGGCACTAVVEESEMLVAS